MTASLGLLMGALLHIKQRGETRHCHDNDVTASATITTVGASERDELLPAERDATCAAIARTDKNLYLINKLYRNISPAYCLQYHHERL